ncbi:MAG: bifunctional acetate--CoA ligase family protein/GNAT family N-acetyltransferase [Opitutaceae bacterium]|nr:bifunctional acetate--CoA ligase family protein/GNAT family N-acetyltransferase [Opitutaceae bacterium]
MKKSAQSAPTRAAPRPAAGPPLGCFFAPRSLAVIGASEKPGSVGRALLENTATFGGVVYPVNPHHARLLDRPAWARIADVPGGVDLALIATPAATVPGVVRECARAGVKGAIVFSAGFKECGPEGAALEREVLAEARRGGLRLVGPNCLGIMAPHQRLNATFAAPLAQPGHVAFVSQSGALCSAVLDWSRREKVGFSAFVSVGSMLDVGWGDLIDALGDDPRTRSIILYMESIGDARSFLSAAREVSFSKPIIVVKVGRTPAAAKAAASHTGALTGSDAVCDAAFRRAGVLRVATIEDMFDMAEILSKQAPPQGRRLGIVTNAGGPGALAVDQLVSIGGELAPLTPETLAALGAVLPPAWSRGNPVDILGDADEHRFEQAVTLVARDPTTDGVLVILTPQAMTDPLAIARRVTRVGPMPGGKPLLASWMGGPGVEAGEAVLNEAGVPTFKYPDRAAVAFDYLWRHGANVRALYETPVLAPEPAVAAGSYPDPNDILQAARRQRRTILTQWESKQVLAAHGLPVVPAFPADSEDAAVARGRETGFPVAVKLHSATLTHKREVGGVCLSVRNADGVRQAWRSIRRAVTEKAGAEHFQGVTIERMIPPDGVELLLGSSVDAQFGPVVVFGAGGRLVEVLGDRALGLPPLTSTLARQLIGATRISRAFGPGRGQCAVDLAALEQLVVRFSQFVAGQRWIKEVDINPLFASPGAIVALDARIILHDPDVTEAQLPVPAIRPYPAQYAQSFALADGTRVSVRPIRPEDEPMMVEFHGTLSDQSVYYRYFSALSLRQRTNHARLARLCFVDYDREMALVAVVEDPKRRQPAIVGVGRLCREHGRPEGEFAVVVSDAWQRRGLGTRLLRRLVDVGRAERLTRITGVILAENGGMRRACERVGFQVRHGGGPECTAEISL